MRYLQTEWQRNERDRIQWELERAEMKTRIAKLEGEKRGLEVLVENQAKKLRILQSGLRNHRDEDENNKEGTEESSNDVKELLNETQRQFDDYVESQTNEERNDGVDVSQLVESRQYLEKCIQEVEYLLQSSSLDQPEDPNNLNGGGQNYENPQEPDRRSGNAASSASTPPIIQQPQKNENSSRKQKKETSSSSPLSTSSSSNTKDEWTVKFSLENKSQIRVLATGFDNELVGGCHDGSVSIWKFSGPKKSSREFKAHDSPVSAVAVGQGNVLYTGDVSGNISKWSLDIDGSTWSQTPLINVPGGHDDSITKVLVCETNIIITSSGDGTVKVWKFKPSQDEEGDEDDGSKEEEGIVLMPSSTTALNYEDYPQAVGIGYYKGNVIIGYDNNVIEMFDVDTGASIYSFKVVSDDNTTTKINNLVVLVGQKTIVCGTNNGTIKFIDIQTKECVQSVKTHTRSITELSITSAERHLITSSLDGFVKVWNLVPSSERGQLVYSLDASAVEARYIGDNYVVVRNANGAINIYDTKEEY